MKLTDELKIIDEKFKASQVQYDLDREAAKMSALSSKELDKYEYLTGKDLEHKPSVIEQVKQEHHPLGKTLSGKVEKNNKQKNKQEKQQNRTNKRKLWFIISAQLCKV